MTKIITIIPIILSLMILSSCNLSTDILSDNSSNTAPTEVNNEEVLTQYFQLQQTYALSQRIYDENIKDTISAYCENYLSFEGSSLDNTESIKEYVTDDYYKKLTSEKGQSKANTDYQQATALNKLYFGDYSKPTDEIEISALCYQTTVHNKVSQTYNTFYLFNMTYSTEKGWLISDVSKPTT